MKKDYKKHFNIHDIVRLVQHLVKDEQYGYAFMLMIGSTLGYKIGMLLDMKWENFVDENGKCLNQIKTGLNEPRPVTKFLKGFIEYVYQKTGNPSLDSTPFVHHTTKEQFNTRTLNRELKRIQKKYISIVGMPYPLETDTMRRVFGLSVWDKWHYQNAALGVLRKHFGHNSDKMTREFLMIPEKLTTYKINEIYDCYDPKWSFETIAL